MVRLDRITMQGFKSFAGKVMLPFPEGFMVVAGPNGSGKCAHYDTIVTLSDGSNFKLGKLVEDAIDKASIKQELDDGIIASGNGTKILTLNNKLKIESKPIKTFIKRKSPKKMLFIKTRSGREIKTTPYHPFFGINESGIFSLEAKDLQKGRKIAVPRTIKIFEKPKIQEFTRGMDNLYVPYSDEIKNIIKTEIKKLGLTYKQFAQRADIPVSALEGLMDKQSIQYKNLQKLIEFYGLNISSKKIKSKNANKPFSISALTPEVARFLGYMISEGQSTNSNQLWFVNDDEDLINDFVGICNSSFDVKANIFSYKGLTKDVIVFSKPLQIWLDKNFGLDIGSKSAEKSVPYAIFYSSEDIIKNFLASLFEGDGYFNLKGRQTYFEYSTASKELAHGIQHLLLRLGVLSNIKEKIKHATNTKNKTKRTYFSIYVYGNSLEILLKQLELKGRKKFKVDKIKELNQARNPNIDLVPNANFLVKELVKECKINIKKVKKICPKLDAYCYNQCECSRNGLKEVIDAIRSHGNVTARAEIIISQLLMLADSDIFWDEIVDVKEIESPEWVYDLTVDETHNYIANNFFVHNSNIIDGLTFVLGTTSARLIRAQKLQNLIFNGGKDRKPAEFCEVSIYLDNSDGKIPGDNKEIKITRRITRSGISIYKLDGHTVTRAKVIDTISYAGLSPEGHNIILQGDVTNIIQMNPKERREIIDDISGIAEFDDKKDKATKELEKVETRVRENMIVVAEKQRLVARLKEEKETAEKYRKLEQEMKSAKASAFKKKFEDAQEKMGALEKEISSGSTDFEKMEKEFDKLEKELEEKEKSILKKSDVLIKKSKNYDLQRQIDTIQTEIIRKKDRVDLYEREITRLRAESDNPSIREILAQNWDGVHGKFIDLIKIPKKFSTAMSVAIGKHANDIVVDDENIAANCIKHLKERKVGTARFIPLSIIRGREKRAYKGPEKLIGYAIDIIEFERKYQKAAEFVIGNTIVVDTIDTAKRIRNFRIVTLDGDLVEESGAMIGGFLARKNLTQSASIGHIQEEMNKLTAEITNGETGVEKLKDHLEDEGEEMIKLQQSAGQDEKLLDELRKKRKDLYEQRLRAQGDVGKKKIEKARLEATFDNMKLEVKGHEGIVIIKGSLEELEEKARRCIIEINKLGPINMKALDEYGTLNVEYEELKKKLDKLLEEKDAIMTVVHDVEKKRYDKFMETMNSINKNFAQIYMDLTGGEGRLRLEEDNNIISGLLIEASPSGKKILNLDSMSGGEKSMTSLAFLFAILQHFASPFYVLDEVDAALDKANTKRVMSLVKRYSSSIQFIVISHSDTTIAEADKVYGVSMENGISKVFGIDLHGQHSEIETKEDEEAGESEEKTPQAPI